MPKNKPEIVNVPKANYFAVRGKGNPNIPDGEYQRVVGILYAAAYTLKMSYKTDYKIEGFWMGGRNCGPKENYMSDARKVLPEKWKMVIRHPIRNW